LRVSALSKGALDYPVRP